MGHRVVPNTLAKPRLQECHRANNGTQFNEPPAG